MRAIKMNENKYEPQLHDGENEAVPFGVTMHNCGSERFMEIHAEIFYDSFTCVSSHGGTKRKETYAKWFQQKLSNADKGSLTKYESMTTRNDRESPKKCYIGKSPYVLCLENHKI